MSKFKSKKLRYSILIVLLCAVFVGLGLSGCAKPKVDQIDINMETPETTLQYSDFGKPVTSSDNFFYYVPNNLAIENMERTEDGFTKHLVTFSGLKDKGIEDKVNSIIEDSVIEVQSLLEPETIAPYRGIRTLLEDSTSIWNKEISTYVAFNNNNIISVSVWGSGNFNYSEMSLVSVVRTENIDLNTGKHIPLSALFIDGFDYKKAINDAILDELSKQNAIDEVHEDYFYNPLTLVKPFDTISENQPFLLNDYTLTILFDESDDRFTSSFSPVEISINLSEFEGQLAIGDRYMDKNSSLYLDEKEKRMLISWSRQGKVDQGVINGTITNGEYTITTYFATNNMKERAQALTDDLLDWVKNENLSSEGSFIEIYISSIDIGPYTQLSSQIYNESAGQYEIVQSNELYNDMGERINLVDLFVDASKVNDIILDKIKEQCDLYDQYEFSEVEKNYEEMTFFLYEVGLEVIIPMNGNNNFYLTIPYDAFDVYNWVMFQE